METRYADCATGGETERTPHHGVDWYEGYNGQKLRRLANEYNIRPHVKHREFAPRHKARNARLGSNFYHKQNVNETVDTAIKQKFGAFVRSRLWWKQSRELIINRVVHNLGRGLVDASKEGECQWVQEECVGEYRDFMQQKGTSVGVCSKLRRSPDAVTRHSHIDEETQSDAR